MPKYTENENALVQNYINTVEKRRKLVAQLKANKVAQDVAKLEASLKEYKASIIEICERRNSLTVHGEGNFIRLDKQYKVPTPYTANYLKVNS